MKKIEVNGGEYIYADYKEPFEQLEAGVPGHPVGVILKTEDGKLLCAFCGGTYDNLGNHSRLKHGLNAEAYKREVGLLNKSALVSETERQRRVRNAVLGQAEGRLRRAAPPSTVGRRFTTTKRRPEALNKTGRCYSQILTVAKSIRDTTGRLTIKRLAQHGISERTWHHYFASFGDLARAAGGTSTMPRPKYLVDADLLLALRNLALELGRTPTNSDLRRYGMPTFKVYAKRWGSYQDACKTAGLIPNQPSPGTSSPFDQVAILNAYATTGSSLRSGKALGISESAVLGCLHRFGFPFRSSGRHSNDERSLRQAWAADMATRLST